MSLSKISEEDSGHVGDCEGCHVGDNDNDGSKKGSGVTIVSDDDNLNMLSDKTNDNAMESHHMRNKSPSRLTPDKF